MTLRWASVGLLSAVLHAMPALAGDENLIEYSYGGFADGDRMHWPMLVPPIVKIYRDGRIVFLDRRGVWQGQIGERELHRYEARLAAEKFLDETRLVHVDKGSSPGMHGGMAYIRYLDGPDEVVLGAMLIPSGGAWNRIVQEIRSHLPSSFATFRPKAVSAYVYAGRDRDAAAWPFGDRLPLAPHVGRTLDLAEEDTASFVLVHSQVGFSWLACDVVDAGQPYSLMVRTVPGWYEPEGVAAALADMAR